MSLPGSGPWCMIRASLRSADLATARVSPSVDVDLPVDVDLSDATLMFADLSRARIVSSEFTDAVLFGVDLSGASLDSVEFSGADLWLSNFSGADLSGTRNLTQTQLDSVCIDPNSNVHLPANSELTSVNAELYFEACYVLTSNAHKRYALFELLFKLSLEASGDPLDLLGSMSWGYAQSVLSWLTLQSPGMVDTISRFTPGNVTENVGMLGVHLYREAADAQAAGESTGSVKSVELSSFAGSEIELLRSRLCQDGPWTSTSLCKRE